MRTSALSSALLTLLLPGIAAAATPYRDVASNHANVKPILYLHQESIMTGYADETFRPDLTLNRAELTKVLVETIVGQPDAAIYRNCFPDVRTEWFAPYVCYALSKGWISGYPDGTFKPGGFVNIAETIKILVAVRYGSPSNGSLDAYCSPSYNGVDEHAWYVPYLRTALSRNIIDCDLLWGRTGEVVGSFTARKRIAEYLYRSLLSEGAVSWQIGSASHCSPGSLPQMSMQSTTVVDGNVIDGVRQDLSMEGRTSCLISRDINPYYPLSDTYAATMLVPMGVTQEQAISNRTTVTSFYPSQGRFRFTSGHPTGGSGPHIWEYDTVRGTLKIIDADARASMQELSPDQTFLAQVSEDGLRLSILNLNSGEREVVADAEEGYRFVEIAFTIDGSLRYVLANTAGDRSEFAISPFTLFLSRLQTF